MKCKDCKFSYVTETELRCKLFENDYKTEPISKLARCDGNDGNENWFVVSPNFGCIEFKQQKIKQTKKRILTN